jgi:flagellar hook-associated protein 2
MGISVSRSGELEVNDSKLDNALSKNYADIIQMFSANSDDQSTSSSDPAGLAGDINRIITNVTASSGYLITQQKVLADSNAVRETELTELEARMERVEERYNRQFLAMQQIIDQMNSTKESMKSSFENLPFSNRD